MESFTDVYDAHVWDVYGFFAYRLGSRADAEDLTQLTFERALRAWARYDPRRAPVRTWLMTIAHNLLIDHHRRAPTRSPVALDDLGAREPAADPEYRIGMDPRLAAALASLSPREREVLALRFGADLDGPAIATVLELSLANVQQIASRALRALRVALLDGEGAGAGGAREGEQQQTRA